MIIFSFLNKRRQTDDYVLVLYDSDKYSLDNVVLEMSKYTDKSLNLNQIKDIMNLNGRFVVFRGDKSLCNRLRDQIEVGLKYL